MNSAIILLLVVVFISLIQGCGSTRSERDGPPPRPVSQAEIERIPEPKPRKEKPRPANQKPYTVFGKTYYPLPSSEGFVQRGIASWYGKKFHGRRTANGEIYDMYAMTAAHTRLPLPTYVRVRNLANGRSIIVRVNDRGPFSGKRVIDLSYAAARKLDFVMQGTAQVEITAISNQANSSQPLPENKHIFLQIAAFYNQANAQKTYRELQHKTSQPLHIQTAQTHQGMLYRVQIGPFASINGAEEAVQKLQQKGIQGTQILLR